MNKNKNMKTFGFSVDNSERLTSHASKSLLEQVDWYVSEGWYVSKAEFMREAIREKLVKLADENMKLQEINNIRNFNKTHSDKVLIDGKIINIKKGRINHE